MLGALRRNATCFRRVNSGSATVTNRPPIVLKVHCSSSKASGMATASSERIGAILEYWFGAAYATADDSYVPKDRIKMWFGGGAEVDKYIMDNFAADLVAVGSGAYDSWRESGGPLGTVAGIILMDQFTRNIYRGTPAAFKLDSKALDWAEKAVADGTADQLPAMLRYFVYMPFMHSEELPVLEKCVELFNAVADSTAAAGHAETSGMLRSAAGYAAAHRDVVARWGRFPHRNAILGRPNTPEEEAGLADGSIKKF